MVIIFLHDLYNWLNCKDSKFHVDTLIRLPFIAKMPGIVFFETACNILFFASYVEQSWSFHLIHCYVRKNVWCQLTKWWFWYFLGKCVFLLRHRSFEWSYLEIWEFSSLPDTDKTLKPLCKYDISTLPPVPTVPPGRDGNPASGLPSHGEWAGLPSYFIMNDYHVYS